VTPRIHQTALALAVCLLLLGRVPARAGPDASALDEAWAGRVQRLVKDLEGVAARCGDAKLFRTRNDIYERILDFDPDHATARKWLRYRRDASGAWVRPGTYKPPRNMGKSGLKDALAALDAAGNALADDALALLSAGLAGTTKAARARIVREALRVAPDRRELRLANRETQTAEGGWILEETARAITRHKELVTGAARAVDEAPAPERARPTREENATLLRWNGILQGKHVRLMGTPNPAELERCERCAEACFGLWRSAFGSDAPPSPGFTMYVLRSGEERLQILKNHPDSNPEYAAYATARTSSWFPKTRRTWMMSPSASVRLEWCVRQALGWMLGAEFGVKGRVGWAFEGFGLYLSHLITGTRQTYFVQRTRYNGRKPVAKDDLWTRLRQPGADWRAEARTLLASGERPDLRLLLGKGVNTMTTEEMLYSYVLAAYCLEGHGERAGRLLHAVGKDRMTPGDALRKALDMDVDDLEARVARWLDETAGD
jgi:hypothetical protein